MSVPGTGAYAALNALAAFVAALETLKSAANKRASDDFADEARLRRSLVRSLATHEGVARRMQLIGETMACAVYDDYAHHPTAARLAIAAIRERHANARVAVAFQPHTFARTEAMFDAFADALGAEEGADALVVTPVFDARPERGRASRDGGVAARLAARAGGAFAATEEEAVDALVDAVGRGANETETSAKKRRKGEDDRETPRRGEKAFVVLCLGAGAGFDVARRVFARVSE